MVCISDRPSMSFQPLPLLTLASLISLIILILLGNWQWARFAEKSSELIEQRVENEVRDIAVVVESPTGGAAIQIYGLIDGDSVWRRYVPGRINGIGEPVLVLYDATIGTERIPLGIFGLGTIRIDGLSNVFVRENRRGVFTPRNDPSRNIWYSFDGSNMISRYGYPISDQVRVVESKMVKVRRVTEPEVSTRVRNPYYGNDRVDDLPRERHLGYAITWWGMSIALIVIYLVFHYQQGRLKLNR